MPDDATVEIMLKWKQENEWVPVQAKEAIGDMKNALWAMYGAEAGGLPAIIATTMAVKEQTEAVRANATTQVAAAAATAQWYSPLQALIGLLPTWVAWVAGAALVLAPFTAVVVSAAVALTSFAVGGAATVAVLGAMAFGFAAIGGGLVLLSNHFAWINNSMAQLKSNASSMGVGLAAEAAPSANAIVQFIDSLVPLAGTEGAGIIDWFQARIPGALSALGVAIRNLTPDLNSFGQFLGGVFDHVSPQLANLFQSAIRDVLIPATEGAITNLVRLSDWFQKELPSIGPIVQQVFEAAGSIIQGLASGWATFNDWIVKNWKPTIDEAARDWKNITDGWEGVDWSGLTGNMQGVAGAIKGIGDAASVALGWVGQFIDMLQTWADNNGFWSSLQNHLIDIGNAIKGIVNSINNSSSWPSWLDGGPNGGQSSGPPGGSFATAYHGSMVAGDQTSQTRAQTNYITITTPRGQDPAVTARALARALANV